tara:strand:- start:1768 stop:2250 length:483 start_codon:yes stop_codon:yes gene_type:complete
MGWFHDLGNKIKGEVHSIGKKLSEAGHRAAKVVHKVAPVVKDIAGKVSSVAGAVAKGAEMAAPFVQEIPVVGEVVDVAAGAGELVSKVASGVEEGAEIADKLAQEVNSGKAIERGKSAAMSAGMSALEDVASKRKGIKDAATGAGKEVFNKFVGHNVFSG